MAWARAGIVAVAVLVAVLAFSGGTAIDPPVPRGFPGVLPAFLLQDGAEAVEGVGPPPGQRGVRGAVRRDRRWLERSLPLAAGAPPWARRLYRRSLLVLRALTDLRTGAAVAGARAGWAYVWPRDAATTALAFAAAGYRVEARRVTHFLLDLDIDAAARFRGTGVAVPGRAAQGDAAGWVVAATRAAGLEPRSAADPGGQGVAGFQWRDRADYQEGDAGDYLANAVAAIGSGVLFPAQRRERRTGSAGDGLRAFAGEPGLVRIAGEPGSGWDSAAAWGVRPFPRPSLFPAIRRTLREAGRTGGRFGIVPSENWHGGDDPWTAPTAWTAWGLSALARDAASSGHRAIAARDRRAAMALLADLRRAATPLGLLPERVDAETGLPASTTPLAWSHAFAILALRELWPRTPASSASAPGRPPYGEVR